MAKHYVRIGDQEYTFRQLSEIYHIKWNTIYYRYQKGLRGKELIKEPDSVRNSRKEITFKGKKTTLDDLAKETGISKTLLRGRVYAGLHDDELVQPKKTSSPYVGRVQTHMSRDPEFVPIMKKLAHGTKINELTEDEKEKYRRGYRRYLARIYRHRPDKEPAFQQYYNDYYQRKGRAIRQRKPANSKFQTNFAKYYHRYYTNHPQQAKRYIREWSANKRRRKQ